MRFEGRFVDLFGTPGGMSLGFEMAGFQSVAAIDIDKYGIETYKRNFPGSNVLNADIRSQDAKKLLGQLENIDVVVGGPPCQGFSLVGRIKIASLAREGIWELSNSDQRFIDDPRNLLYREFVAAVKALQPKIFVMENVPGMMSYHNGQFVEEIVREFSQIGYRTGSMLLRGSDFCLPQKRKRLFFIGNRIGLENLFPKTKFAGLSRVNGGNVEGVNVWDAIGDLPTIRAGHGAEEMDYTKGTFSDYQDWARNGFRQKSKKVNNHVSRHHDHRDIETFKVLKEGQQWKDLPSNIKRNYGYRDEIFQDKFRRFARDDVAGTITSHLSKDGYAYIHPTQQRTLTVREAARLQTFPDDFVFCGPRTHQFHQVGRAVMPLLAKEVAIVVKEMLMLSGEIVAN